MSQVAKPSICVQCQKPKTSAPIKMMCDNCEEFETIDWCSDCCKQHILEDFDQKYICMSCEYENDDEIPEDEPRNSFKIEIKK